MSRYVLGIDQSTQGTKGLLFDENGALICRSDLPHRQYIDQRGWVEHDPEEIYANTVQVVKKLVEKSGIDKNDIKVLGISNQRETALVWDRNTGKPVYNAVVWQCARGAKICHKAEKISNEDQRTDTQCHRCFLCFILILYIFKNQIKDLVHFPFLRCYFRTVSFMSSFLLQK